jgi:hypothetical protein
MSRHPGALSVVIGLAVAGLIGCGGCGAGPASTAGPPGPVVASAGTPAASAGTAIASAGTATASPGVVVTMPPTPPGGGAGGGAQRRHRLLTVTDDGALMRLRIGQVVTVVLTSGGLRWNIPRASGAAVRQISGSGGYPAYRPAVAVFRAAQPGRSWLTASTNTPCLHTQPQCEIPQRLWRALIIVLNT